MTNRIERDSAQRVFFEQDLVISSLKRQRHMFFFLSCPALRRFSQKASNSRLSTTLSSDAISTISGCLSLPPAQLSFVRYQCFRVTSDTWVRRDVKQDSQHNSAGNAGTAGNCGSAC